MSKFFLCSIGLLLPFELGIAEAAHGLLHPIIGQYYLCAFVGYWAIPLLLLVLARKFAFANAPVWLLITMFVFSCAGLWECAITYYLRGPVSEAQQQFCLGFLFPSLLIVVLGICDEDIRRSFFRSLYFGMLVMICGAFLVLAATYRQLPQWFLSLPLSAKLIEFRYAFPDEMGHRNYFMELVGNFNKFSNYILLLLLFSGRLIGWKPAARRGSGLFFSFWFFSTLILILMFSRLALLLLPLAVWGSGILSGLSKDKIVRILIVVGAGTGMLFAFAFNAVATAFNYLLFSTFADSTSKGFLGTGHDRFEQWTGLMRYFSDAGIWLHGMGTTTYGETQGDINLGTHNLFLDHFLGSGVWVPGSILALMIGGFLAAIHRHDRVVAVAFPMIFLLMIREYSFSYLYVSSLGGVVFTTTFLLLFRRDSCGTISPRQVREVRRASQAIGT